MPKKVSSDYADEKMTYEYPMNIKKLQPMYDAHNIFNIFNIDKGLFEVSIKIDGMEFIDVELYEKKDFSCCEYPNPVDELTNKVESMTCLARKNNKAIYDTFSIQIRPECIENISVGEETYANVYKRETSGYEQLKIEPKRKDSELVFDINFWDNSFKESYYLLEISLDINNNIMHIPFIVFVFSTKRKFSQITSNNFKSKRKKPTDFKYSNRMSLEQSNSHSIYLSSDDGFLCWAKKNCTSQGNSASV